MAYVKTAAYDHDALPMTCSDEGHAQGCPCYAGGDIEYVTSPLSLLRCSECEEPLDAYGSCDVHGQLDDNREGQPEFNGAFDVW